MRSDHSKAPKVMLFLSDSSLVIPASFFLQAGDKSVAVQAQVDSAHAQDSVNTIQLSRDAARALSLPPYHYKILEQGADRVRIGPVVAVLTTGEPNKPVPTGKKARLFKELIIQGWKEGVFIYNFYPHDVLWGRKLIRGYSCTPQGKWISGYYPFPDVIYNRVLYRSIEKQRQVQHLLKRFDQHPDIYLFNRRFLNKWEVSRVLGEDSRTQQWMPETRTYTSSNLRLMLLQYRELFLKPCNSSKGQGIVKIEKTLERKYRFARTEWKGKNWIKVASVTELNHRLNQQIGSLKHYIIQQGISLARIEGRIFDLRTQSQKNSQGDWVLTGIGARIAAKNRFVTHVPNGGSRANFNEVLRAVFSSAALRSSVEQELRKICRIVPEVLEQGLDIPLGILSLDIGVDSYGRLWILEVNSKPASFDEDHIRKKHLKLLVDYFIFAAQQNTKGR